VEYTSHLRPCRAVPCPAGPHPSSFFAKLPSCPLRYIYRSALHRPTLSKLTRADRALWSPRDSPSGLV
jgi:hypothetical protein